VGRAISAVTLPASASTSRSVAARMDQPRLPVLHGHGDLAERHILGQVQVGVYPTRALRRLVLGQEMSLSVTSPPQPPNQTLASASHNQREQSQL
jgi:hypothetical protein